MSNEPILQETSDSGQNHLSVQIKIGETHDCDRDWPHRALVLRSHKASTAIPPIPHTHTQTHHLRTTSRILQLCEKLQGNMSPKWAGKLETDSSGCTKSLASVSPAFLLNCDCLVLEASVIPPCISENFLQIIVCAGFLGTGMLEDLFSVPDIRSASNSVVSGSSNSTAKHDLTWLRFLRCGTAALWQCLLK